jgi:hypothetical protein
MIFVALFNFGVSESQGKSDSAGSDLGDKGNNSVQQNAGNNDSNSTSQSDNNTSGNVRNKENQENNISEDDDQTVFISSNENHYQYSELFPLSPRSEPAESLFP